MTIHTDRMEQNTASVGTPPSPFLWLGMINLGLAAFVFLMAVMQTMQSQGSFPMKVMGVTFSFLCIGLSFLFAHVRYPRWRQLAGLLDASPLLPESLQVAPTPLSGIRIREMLIVLNLVALATIPRLIVLFQSYSYDELALLEFMKHGPVFALTHPGGGTNHLLNSFLGSLCLEVRTLLLGTQLSLTMPPVWLMRLPSFLFGAASIPMLYITARHHLGRPATTVACILLAFSPMATDISGQALGYSALLFFTLAQGFYLERALHKSIASCWVGWIVCSTLGVLAHPVFLYVVFVSILFALGYAVWSRVMLLDSIRPLVVVEQCAVMTVIWAFLTGICHAGVLGQGPLPTDIKPPSFAAHELLAPTLQAWGGVPLGLFWPIFWISSCVFVILGGWYLAVRSSANCVYSPLLLILPFTLLEVVHPFALTIRVLVFALPAFCMLVAGGMWQLASLAVGVTSERTLWRKMVAGGNQPRQRRALNTPPRLRWRVPLFCFLVGGYCLLTVPGEWEVLQSPRQDYRGVVEKVRELQKQGHFVMRFGERSGSLKELGLSLPPLVKETPLGNLVRKYKKVFVVATESSPAPPTEDKPTWVPPIADNARLPGVPLKVFLGRFGTWANRYYDAVYDITLYEFDANALFPR